MADEANAQAQRQPSEEELRYMYGVYQQQHGMITSTINMHMQDLQELNAAQRTLESSDMLNNKEMLTNIGADFFMKSKLTEANTVVVGVGSDYMVEKDVASAKAFVAKRIQVKSEILNKLGKNKKELEGAMVDIGYRLGQGAGRA
ncbi:MAG TPA: prefoldin subunit alpha [Candidatus Acidoferrales bacterium]|nr:prefoldin subunit alpha [Candidatus Acidoferrales bacterium]